MFECRFFQKYGDGLFITSISSYPNSVLWNIINLGFRNLNVSILSQNYVGLSSSNEIALNDSSGIVTETFIL